MMRVKARVDILVDYKRHEAGSEFEVTEDTGLILLNQGWATKVKEPAPKKATTKKK